MTQKPRLTADGEWRCETVRHMGRRCRDWDYTARCIYEITVVLKDRRKDWLGVLARDEDAAGGAVSCANSGKGGPCEWVIEPTADGRAVVEALLEMPKRYPQVSIIEWQLMPEHFHFVAFVREKLPKPFGALVRGFKAGAVKRWKSLRENAQAQNQRENAQAQNTRENAQGQGWGESGAAPEWAEGFVDTILWREGQLQKMIDYLRDNPRRLAVKRAEPAFFRRVVDLKVELKGCSATLRSREGYWGHFSALGNRFLLERPLAQVQVSRAFFGYQRVAKPGGGLKIARDAAGEPIAAFKTSDYEARREEFFAAARHGAVLLSPCISDGERQIAHEALAAGLPLVTMQNKGFSRLQKPSGRYFDACASGKLLMLAPRAWPFVPGEKKMTRFDATALNRLCQWIADDGAAEINYKGMKPTDINELALAAVR